MLFRLTTLCLLLWTMTGCDSDSTSAPLPTDELSTALTPEATPVEETPEAVNESPGRLLFEQFREEVGFACATCHYVSSDNRLLGPGLLSVESRFQSYDIEVENVESYLRESIVTPDAFIAPGEQAYPENIMPRIYADILTDDEINEIIDYILSF